MGTPADTKRGSVVIFESNESATSILEGFTITGGTGFWFPSESARGGGGILFIASSGTVRNCVIVGNNTGYGGGIGCAYPCSPKLIDCTIDENLAGIDGGGVFLWQGPSLTMINCTIRENSTPGFGAGLHCGQDSSLTMTDCTISKNSVTGDTPHVAGYGGGLCCMDNSMLTLTNCNIMENSAGIGGGGIKCHNSCLVTLTNCTITGNSASIVGGGMFCTEHSSVTMTNCIVSGNSATGKHQAYPDLGGGGGMCFLDNISLTLTNCTIAGNSAADNAGGMVCDFGCSGSVTNSIVLGNTAPIAPDISLISGSTLDITYSDVAGGKAEVNLEGKSILNWGQGNIDADPLFADPNNDDFHLKSEAGRWDLTSQIWVLDDVSSPCIDAGDPNSPTAFELYPNGGRINMGAYGGTAEASQSPSGLHAKYGGGKGESNDPYLIYTAVQMNAIGVEPNDWDKHFKLMADIDLSAYTGTDFNVIGYYADWVDYVQFSGILDGNGHTISNFSYTSTDRDGVGLFGYVEGGTIKDLGLIDPNVDAGTGGHVGSLVGDVCRGTINNCYAEGTNVTGHYRIGGLVGQNSDNVTNCYSTGTINGTDSDVGGLVGYNGTSGDITNSHSTGTVNGNKDVGGLVGNNTGSITSSYSTGSVSGDDNVGGLVGFNSGSITSSFWDIVTSGLSESAGGVGLTTAEMHTAATFLEAGWDFVDETENGTEDIWWILEGQDYPRLWWELITEN
ncbi:MAG: right-handed parallel beta-helix repeat-containing protein [Planctomycetota bacterium]